MLAFISLLKRISIFFLLAQLVFLHAEVSYPAKRSSVRQHEKPLIVLDPGHGGEDQGAKSKHLVEKKLTLLTSLFLRTHLTSLGYRVIMTRNKDIFIPLHRRVSIANKTKAAVFVSVHYNASYATDAKGIEIFYHATGNTQRANSSKQLACKVLDELNKLGEVESRGVKKGNFYVIRDTQMPAILIEAGFITNLEDSSHLSDSKYVAKLAKAISEGIDKYLKS